MNTGYNSIAATVAQGLTTENLPETILGRATSEISLNGGVDAGMVLLTYLSAMSAVAQGGYDVELPTGQRKPLAGWFSILAPAGKGKSPVFHTVYGPIINLEKEYESEYKEQMDIYENNNKINTKKMQKLHNEIAKLELEGEDASSLRAELLYIKNQESKIKPVRCRSIYENATNEAIIHGLKHNLPFVTLASPEGGNVTRSRVLQDPSVGCALWDRDRVSIDRVRGGCIELIDSSLGMLLMIQPEVMTKYLSTHSDIAIGSGMTARLIPYKVPSNGYGYGAKVKDEMVFDNINIVTARLLDLYRESIAICGDDDKNRNVLRFSDAATSKWVEVNSFMSLNVSSGGIYFEIKEWALKLPQHVARLAALISLFDHDDGLIEVTHIEQAFKICMHCAEHYRSIFCSPPQELEDAIVLDKWLQQRQHNIAMEVNKARQNCPLSLRGKRFYRALEVMENFGRIAIFELPPNGKKSINLNFLSSPMPNYTSTQNLPIMFSCFTKDFDYKKIV